MRVLLTGGAGAVGSVVTRSLLNLGHEPLVYDNLSGGNRDAVPRDVPFIFGDVRNSALLKRVMKDRNIEALMHFAGIRNAAESVRAPFQCYDVNTVGGFRAIEACRSVGAFFIFSSTVAASDPVLESPISEEVVLSPISPFEASKLFVERMAKEFGERGQLQYACLRNFNAIPVKDLADKHIQALNDLKVGRKNFTLNCG